jgi:putative ABC transport system permease protein
MAIPFSYSVRNLLTRRLTTMLTAGGMALVVFVFSTILMLSDGLRKTLVETGSYDNVVVIRKGSATEVQSGIEREQAYIVETEPEIAIGEDGNKLLAKELVVLINLPKKDGDKPANVVIRGIGPNSVPLRAQVRLVEGRLPRLGSTEIIVGRSIYRTFKNVGINESVLCGLRNWRVVGIFDAGSTAFSSEIWGDADQLMQAFRRPAYSSVIFKLRNSAKFDTIKSRIESDPRLTLEVRRETKYYSDQSEVMAKFLRILGFSLTLIFSVGAIIGAMITMYAAVASRTREIGTLRSLGFRRRSIMAAFILESLILGFIGGFAGLFIASFMQFITISTMNFQTFAELAFSFVLTFENMVQAMAFSLIMGILGGVLPAIRASRMNIVEALRTV